MTWQYLFGLREFRLKLGCLRKSPFFPLSRLGFVTLLANQQLRKIWISLLPLPVALRHLTATPQGLIVPLNMDYQGIFVQQLLSSH